VGVGSRSPVLRTLLALTAALGLAACTAPPPEGSRGGALPGPSFSTPPTSLRLAITQPASLDPRDLSTPDSLLLAAQLFDGLVGYDPTTLELIPAAAGWWEMEDAGRRFVFHLRRGATFHDGSPVTAQDFRAAWNRLADPAAANPFAFLLEPVQGFEEYQSEARVSKLSGVVARDERTLEVTLVEPWPDFPALLGHPALSPVPASVGQRSAGQQPVGNGPFRLAAPLAPGTPIVMERFEDYHGEAAKIETLEWRTYDDPEAGWPEFLAGDLEIAPIPGPLVPEASSRYGDRGILTLARLLYCAFDQSERRFQDPALRRAVSLAVDRDAIAQDVYGGVAGPASGIVPPSIPGGREDACGARCRLDRVRAQALVRELPRESRSFALDYPASPVGDRLAAQVSSQLAEVGLRATPRPHDEAGYRALLNAGDQQMFCLVWLADFPRQQALLEPLLRTESEDNQASIADERLDALLGEAREQAQPGRREALYAEAENSALAKMLLIPLVWFRSHLAAQPYVDGFTLDPLARFDAATLAVTP
jgi:oligopeptide transport system substrate-binding protein